MQPANGDGEPVLPWIVACLSRGSTTDHEMNQVRSLTPDEAADALKANALLHALTTADSPYGRLEARLDQFDLGVSSARQSMEAGGLRTSPPLGERFGDVMSAFGRFINQSPHRLRAVFGRASAGERAFLAACKTEYDRAFEYRLAWNLRNETEHRTDVLRVTLGQALGQPARVDTVISDEVLNNALKDTKWQALVREDLKERTRPIDAHDVLRVIRGSCQRIHFSALLAHRGEIERALEIVRELAYAAKCDGQLALVSARPPDVSVPGSRLTMTIQYLETKAADILAAALTEGELLL